MLALGERERETKRLPARAPICDINRVSGHDWRRILRSADVRG